MSKKKKVIIWIVIAAAVLGGIFFYFKTKKTEVERVTETVKIGNVMRTVSVTGEVIPEKQADLAFETGGKIKSIEVEVGDEVEKGQAVAALDASVIESQLKEARAALDIQKEKLDLSRRKWDDLKPEEKAAKKLAVDQARAGVQTIKEQLKKAVLYSPFKGVVSARAAEPGEIAQVGAAIVSVIQEGELKIEAEVPESDIAEISLGQKADVTFDALPFDEVFKAEIISIEPDAAVIQDAVYYKVKLKLENVDQRIRPGMSADVDILTAQKNNVLIIPERAVKDENGKKTVQILLEGEKTKEVEVETGMRGDGGMIEIKSGLKEGDEAVVFVKE